ncbi:unnamed protein product [Microthlaspi erraticum]|uniref:Uncharacterized protein n=1 Tax=Microthlaspi erraticum TaxID=1685480 RepID=A0A6D2JM11_9BRAS|nr:unnamed protein product [Microthlaspi erraticum]
MGEQKELANLHSKIPAKYRHEISKITARICVGIGLFEINGVESGGGWTQPDDTDIVVESATGGSDEVV